MNVELALTIAAGGFALALALAAIVLAASWRYRRQHRRTAAEEGMDDRIAFPPDAHGRRDTPGPHHPETTYESFT